MLHWMVTELVEKLEEILLDDSNLDQMTKIGTLANPAVRQVLTTFLRNNLTCSPRATKTCQG